MVLSRPVGPVPQSRYREHPEVGNLEVKDILRLKKER